MKMFNTTGVCVPDKHYMVDLSERLKQIRVMVDAGQYFTINRARQYGKTTTLAALALSLRDKYRVLSLDFQGIGSASFQTEEKFVKAFCRHLRKRGKRADIPEEILEQVEDYIERKDDQATLDVLFDTLNEWCDISERPIVMLIDEVDSAANNQVFLDFLSQLRLQYIEKDTAPDCSAFHSVILAGVTDIKNLKRKLRTEESHKINSPWNIAAEFNIDMSLSADGITGMLNEYENDHHTSMDTAKIAQEIYDYTNGYPFLVSRICQLLDTQVVGERFADLSEAWTSEGVSEAVRRILMEKNTLFDSLMGKIYGNTEMNKMIEWILFSGDNVPYNNYNLGISDAEMYGFVTNNHGNVSVSNRIFETLLYNYYLSVNELNGSAMLHAGADAKLDFVKDGKLMMKDIFERYLKVFDDIYEDNYDKFDEAEGRRRFLLFIRPIINGTGNYYIEVKTRSNRRMDIVIDYLGVRYVIELKIWRGKAYHEEGETQLADYLDYYHLSNGYLLTYSFNKTKERGIKSVTVNGKKLIEILV